MTENIASPILRLFESEPEIAWIEVDDLQLSGKECLREIGEIQASIESQGLEPGSVIFIRSGRGARFWLEVIATWASGYVVVPIGLDASIEDIEYMAAKATPSLLLGFDFESESVPWPMLDATSILSGLPSENDVLARAKPVSKNDLASILFTSGTTGHPKGVSLTHSVIGGNARASASRLKMEEIERVFVPIPFRFVSALSHFIVTLYSGVRYLGSEKKFLNTQLLQKLTDSGCDGFGGSPVQLRWIAELAHEYSVNLKWIMASGDNLSVETICGLKDKIPQARVITAYGLTELGGRFCILPDSDTSGSVGKPIDGLKVTIRDENLSELSAGEIGQVYASGDFLFEGYISDFEKTSAVKSELGLATGDLGYVDESGCLFLSGRSDDVFKSGGLKVSTLPITALLLSTGYFEDLVVVAEPDPILENVPVAYYVLRNGEEFNKGAIMRMLRSSLESHQLPRKFFPIPAIPRTGSGKVKRKELRTLINSLDS